MNSESVSEIAPRRGVGRTAWLAIGLLAATSCASPRQPLIHVQDRVNYALQDSELMELQYFISTEILARDLARGDDPESVLIVEASTPGRVVAVGANWLRVSFSPEGRGVVFVADADEPNDGYWLATETDEGGFAKLSKRPDKILVHGGQRFRLIRGAGAYLLVDRGGLADVVERRRHIDGRTK